VAIGRHGPSARLSIEHAKTAAGVREVDLSLDLVEELNAWRAECKPASVDGFVFATASGRPRDKESVRERVLLPVVNRANEIRVERGMVPLPKITPHALRRTYISLMLEAGAPLPYVRSGRPRRLEDDAGDLRPGAEARVAQGRARDV
jgi:integrase